VLELRLLAGSVSGLGPIGETLDMGGGQTVLVAHCLCTVVGGMHDPDDLRLDSGDARVRSY
jgi:hypothetical protein